MNDILTHIDKYHKLSAASRAAFLDICTAKHFCKGSFLQQANESARYIYFIQKGVVGYYTTNEKGAITYKMFFAENSFVASTSAVVGNLPSDFAIIALEDCQVIRYSAAAFRSLYQTRHDIALFHIHYLEENWVVKKEPLEIALRNQTAKERYLKLRADLSLYSRLKKHHIASYLGITPTQLSRIRKELKT